MVASLPRKQHQHLICKKRNSEKGILHRNPIMLDTSTGARWPIAQRLLFSCIASCALALLLLSFTRSMATAMQGLPSLEQPPLVRLTGSFLRADEPAPAGTSTLTVSLQDESRIFAVKNIEKLTDKPTTGLRLLASLFPPTLRFVGPPAVLDPLRRSDAIGKSFVIEGRLYVGDRMLLLLSAKEE